MDLPVVCVKYPARVASVAWISVAPVKGLALAAREEVDLEPFGVRDNRRFHLIDADGALVNGKRLGRLVTVEPRYDEATNELELRFPDGDVVSAAVETGEAVITSFYGRPVEGRLVRGPWSDAISSRFGTGVRLVAPVEPGAGVDRGRGGVSIVGTASLDALARAAGVGERVDGGRFRMLFGIDGLEPHGEDAWLDRRIRIGGAVVVPRGNVGRCAVTTQNPESGVPDLDTLRVLGAYRGDVPTTEPLPFGVWGEVAEPGRVRVGDEVTPAG
jgi:uncharacterized protein YcbX